MKIRIDPNNSLPEGEYELTDRDKLERVKQSLTSSVSDKQVLVEYDRIGGRVVKNGEVLTPQTLWQIERNRPIEKYTDQEVSEIIRRAENIDVSGSQYQKARNEWQLRQQETNLKQIATLISEIKQLKEITDKNSETSTENARSDNRLSKIAIVIAVVATVLQVIFSIHHESGCTLVSRTLDDPDWETHSHCYRKIDLGLFGTHTIHLPDK